MLLIPLEKDAKTIASRFRKADMFVFNENAKTLCSLGHHKKEHH